MNAIVWFISWFFIWPSLFLLVFFAFITLLEKWGSKQIGWKFRTVKFIYQVFWILDVTYNQIIGSLIFWEVPQNEGETFSVRLRRHLNLYLSNKWRRQVALLFRPFINFIEPGHI